MLGMGVRGSWDVMVGVRSLSGSPSPCSPCDVCCKALGAFNDHNVLTHLMRIKTWRCCKLFLILHSATSQQSSTPLATRHYRADCGAYAHIPFFKSQTEFKGMKG